MSTVPELETIADRDAFVRGLAKALIGDRWAEDVAQSTWLSVLERRAPPPDHPRAWWTSTLRRVWSKTVRGESRRETRERVSAQPERTDPLTEVIEREEARRLLLDALQTLDEGSRTCLLLRYFDGLPPREIAGRLELPVETVKTRIKRGIQRLRAQLDQDSNGNTSAWAVALTPLSRTAHNVTHSSNPLALSNGTALMSTPTKLILAAGILGLGWWLLSPPGEPPKATVELSHESLEQTPLEPPVLPAAVAKAEREEATQTDSVDDESASSSKSSGSLVVITRLDSGMSLGKVPVIIQAQAEADRHRKARFVNTDSEGVARATGLSPGQYSVWSPHGGSARAQVLLDEEARVELVLSDTVTVHGRVVSSHGIPVPGARIWIVGWRTDWLANLPITECDNEGRFSLQHVSTKRALGATASNHGPSALFHLRETTREAEPIVLTLEPTGGAIHGRVTTSEGDPISGTVIAVGDPPDTDMRIDGSMILDWSALTTTTDEDGRYALTGVPIGTQPIHAFAEGFAIHASVVDIPTRPSASTDIQLTAGVTVRGVVSDESGEPVSGAILLALDEFFVDPFPPQGPTNRGSPFHRPVTRSSDDGSFQLLNIPTERLHLYASKGTSSWDSFGDKYHGSAQITLEGTSGQELNWDPVLKLGLSIRGRVMYADGSPMTNVFVAAKAKGSSRTLWSHAAENGSFEIPELEDQAYDISVQLADLPEGAMPVRQENVWPSRGEVLLTADFSRSSEPKATLRARIVDQSNRLKGSGTIVFADPDGWRSGFEEDNVWTATVTAGRYQARVVSGNTTVGEGEWFDVLPGQDVDLGDIYTSAMCSLLVQVKRGPATMEKDLWISVESENHPNEGARPLATGANELLFDDRIEGEVVVTLSGRGVLHQKRKILLSAGTNRIVMEAEAAASCAMQVDCAPSLREGFGELVVKVLLADGSEYLDMRWVERWGGKLPVDFKMSLPVGKVTVEASTTTGLTGTQTITIESLNDSLETELTLSH